MNNLENVLFSIPSSVANMQLPDPELRDFYQDDPRTAVCELTTNYRGWISSHADELE